MRPLPEWNFAPIHDVMLLDTDRDTRGFGGPDIAAIRSGI
jgi:hypothetical protein